MADHTNLSTFPESWKWCISLGFLHGSDKVRLLLQGCWVSETVRARCWAFSALVVWKWQGGHDYLRKEPGSFSSLSLQDAAALTLENSLFFWPCESHVFQWLHVRPWHTTFRWLHPWHLVFPASLYPKDIGSPAQSECVVVGKTADKWNGRGG